MSNLKKRISCLLTSAALASGIIGLLPAGMNPDLSVKAITSNVIDVIDVSTLTSDYEVKDGDVLTGELNSNIQISISNGKTVTLKDLTINGINDNNYQWAGINCTGDVTLNLVGNNIIRGFYESYPGIYIYPCKTLTIEGTGSLDVCSNGWGAGIGGGYNISCGNIVINDGNIKAIGKTGAAGIGSGSGSSCGNITINGGTIFASTEVGWIAGAAIGSGHLAYCENITINDGIVNAIGGVCAAGIGSGSDNQSTCGTISINGGTVTATGGDWAAGIGSGSNASCGDIIIKKDVKKIVATKGYYAINNPIPYSIGTGSGGKCNGVIVIGDLNSFYIEESPYTYIGTAIENVSLTLSNDLELNFYMGEGVTDENAIQFSTKLYGKCIENGQILPLTPKTVNGKTVYCVTASVPAKNIGDRITAELYVGEKLIDTREYSVTDYLDRLDGTENPALKNLVSAVRQYGTASRAYFIGGDIPAVNDHEADVAAFAPAFDPEQATISLVLKSKLAARLYIPNLTAEATAGELSAVKGSGERYCFEITDIMPTQLGTPLTISYNNTDYTFSPLSWCYRVLSNASTMDDKDIAMANALYEYYAAASAYTG